MTLKGQSALVTGGYRGIGKSIALKLAQMGADVIVNDVVDPKFSKETLDEIRAFGVQADAVQADVSKEEDVKKLANTVLERFGKLDILINNAGITKDGLLVKMKESDWQQVIDVNLKGVFLCSKAFIRKMMLAQSGSIVNITSVVGIIGNPGQANYCASKAGVIGFTKALAKEVGGKGVRVNAVAPGFIESAMTEKLSNEVRSNYMTAIPLKRYGLPEEVAEVVVFLCQERSRYMTGQILSVDGGLAL